MRESLDTSLKTALKSQDRRRVATLRLVNAAIKDRDIAGRTAGKERISDEEIVQLLVKMIKQREESARLYDEGGRLDLATQEREEIAIIRDFLPRQLSEAEMEALVAGAIAETGATSVRDLGKVMALLKERHPGKMDFARASAMAKTRLG